MHYHTTPATKDYVSMFTVHASADLVTRGEAIQRARAAAQAANAPYTSFFFRGEHITVWSDGRVR